MTAPIDIRQLFDVALPAAILKLPVGQAKADLGGGIFYIVVSGKTYGAWTIDASAGVAVCRPGQPTPPSSANVNIEIADVDFQALLAAPSRAVMAMQLFYTNKMRVRGSQLLAMKLEKLLSYVGI